MGARDAHTTLGPRRAEPYEGARQGQVPRTHAQGDAVGSAPKKWKMKNTLSSGEWAMGYFRGSPHTPTLPIPT